MAIFITTSFYSFGVHRDLLSFPTRRSSDLSMADGSPCDGNGWSSPCSRPLGTPGHHDRRSPPGSPAGLPSPLTGSAPWHCAPAFRRVCLCQEHQLTGSIGPSVEDLEPTVATRTRSGSALRRSRS